MCGIELWKRRGAHCTGRSEFFDRIRRNLHEQSKHGFTSASPWSAVFAQAIREAEYWAKEFTTPATLPSHPPVGQAPPTPGQRLILLGRRRTRPIQDREKTVHKKEEAKRQEVPRRGHERQGEWRVHKEQKGRRDLHQVQQRGLWKWQTTVEVPSSPVPPVQSVPRTPHG